MKTNTEELIHHFKLFTEGIHVRRGSVRRDRAPEGRFGIYIISDGANKPYRLKIRAAAIRISPRSTKCHAGTCSPTSSRFSARRISCSEIDR